MSPHPTTPLLPPPRGAPPSLAEAEGCRVAPGEPCSCREQMAVHWVLCCPDCIPHAPSPHLHPRGGCLEPSGAQVPAHLLRGTYEVRPLPGIGTVGQGGGGHACPLSLGNDKGTCIPASPSASLISSRGWGATRCPGLLPFPQTWAEVQIRLWAWLGVIPVLVIPPSTRSSARDETSLNSSSGPVWPGLSQVPFVLTPWVPLGNVAVLPDNWDSTLPQGLGRETAHTTDLGAGLDLEKPGSGGRGPHNSG